MKLSADHEDRRSAPGTEVSTVLEASPVSAPVSQHPSADDNPPFPLAEPGEYYIGLWSGKPNYGCPYCGYATLDGSGSVEIHILSKIDQGNLKHLVALDTK